MKKKYVYEYIYIYCMYEKEWNICRNYGAPTFERLQENTNHLNISHFVHVESHPSAP